MTTAQERAIDQVLMLIQYEVGNGEVTIDLIKAKVDQTLLLYPREVLDRDALVKEVETRLAVWIGHETTLKDNDDHEVWLPKRTDSISWSYWRRYRKMLAPKWAPASLDALDRVTDHVLGLLEDPRRAGAWDRRGLVVGHVQSGKTANYTGLICKAADAGYQVVIVLAGMHSNLRSQTQMRLDEGFLGRDSASQLRSDGDRDVKIIGAGVYNPSLITNSITHRGENGDFNVAVAKGFQIHPGGRPLLFVIKKNVSVLKNLLGWVLDVVAQATEARTGRKLVPDVPLLIIDDEADNASVDTEAGVLDGAGLVDPDHDPTKINSLIRKVLFAFQKSAYIGYTATPFANIFIHNHGRTSDEGDDLFPRSFIVNLPTPTDYAGPVKVFGLDRPLTDTDESAPGVALIRHVVDHAATLAHNERNGWMPPRHDSAHTPLHLGLPAIPRSLCEAIQAFVLSAAGRRARGQVNVHNSMLIHITRFTRVQAQVKSQVQAYLDELKRRLLYEGESAKGTAAEELRALWEGDFLPTTVSDFPNTLASSWQQVWLHVIAVVKSIEIREINGTAGDVLDYDTHKEVGLNVIAVGGDKLARGLTLEGLSVSYFLRASRMYDTLMQMGRWFGYRAGYLDLCRLYMTQDLDSWFHHITQASEELRREFDHMAAVGGTPRDYGLKVLSHPAVMVTSHVKMRHGTDLQLSFAGDVSETVMFHKEGAILRRNFEAAQRLLAGLSDPQRSPTRQRLRGQQSWEGSLLWEHVPAEHIVGFLQDVATHPDAIRVDRRLLREFIAAQNEIGELVEWTVALFAGDSLDNAHIAGHRIRLVTRDRNRRSDTPGFPPAFPNRYSIRRLLAPRDEAIDLDAKSYAAAMDLTAQLRGDAGTTGDGVKYPSGPAIRAQRPPRRGLFMLYLLEQDDERYPRIEREGGHPPGYYPVVGFGLSFPASTTARKVRYRVNNVYQMTQLPEDE